MPVSTPPIEALREFLNSTTRHTRRVEIYEQDGITRWGKDANLRLKGGQVTVDYSRDERRGLDLTLSNDDEVLINAPKEFWYDKVIKVFRGVQVNANNRLPRILIMADKPGEDQLAPSFRQLAVEVGYGDIRYNPLAADYAVDVSGYDIIVGVGNSTTTQIALMKQAFLAGKTVLVMDQDANDLQVSLFGGSSTPVVENQIIEPLAKSTHPVSKGWASFEPLGPEDPQQPILDSYPIASPMQTMIAPNSFSPNLPMVTAIQEPVRGGRAVAITIDVFYQQFEDPGFRDLIKSAMAWLNTVTVLKTWEVQIGEFMIDRISEPHFPREVKITGRDYTKKCMKSKFAQATQFLEGMALESIIAAIAGAAGIVKRSLPVTGIVVGRTFFFERGTPRWDAMKEIANAYGYEIFFDATGYLVIRPYNDPLTTAPVLYIETGKEGQIASYEKSTSDSMLYNHILVTGESSDSSVVPVWAEAKNTDPNSPTSIQEIGDRLFEYSSAFIETQQQADEMAATLLSIYSMEEFELSFESLMLPWLEVGDIMGWIDPRPAPGDPTTFLLSNLTLPLELRPMSGSAKRIIVVEA